MPKVKVRPRSTPVPLGEPPDSELVLYSASQLTVIPYLQREPGDARLRQLAAEWDAAREGILFVARIIDGPEKGQLHIYDGGTRWLAQMRHGDSEYVFVCWVRDMTRRQAAAAFIALNTMSTRPHAVYHYRVGVWAREPWALAVREAVEHQMGLVIQKSATREALASVAACRRIIETMYRLGVRRDADDPMEEAVTHLVWTLTCCQRMQDTDWPPADAWNADFVIAMSGILIRNGAGIPDLGRFMKVVGSRPNVKAWTTDAAHRKETLGGSVSRGNLLRQMLVDCYNRGLRKKARMLEGGTPRDEVDDLDAA